MEPSQFNRISKALADPQRFAILERIAAEKELACMCLVDELPITQATISHHLKELASAGLIEARKEGKCHHFTAQRAVLKAYQREFARRLRVVRRAAAKA